MNFFEQMEFPPAELSPSAQVFADELQTLTDQFIQSLGEMDSKMWKACKKPVSCQVKMARCL